MLYHSVGTLSGYFAALLRVLQHSTGTLLLCGYFSGYFAALCEYFTGTLQVLLRQVTLLTAHKDRQEVGSRTGGGSMILLSRARVSWGELGQARA